MHEIQISSISGLNPLVQLYNGTAAVSGSFSAVEIGSTGEYVANMPNVPYGKYLVVVTAGSEKLGSGEIFWDGAYEILSSLALVQGLDPNNPATTTQNSINAGAVNVGITGDGVNSTTLTRQ